MQDNPSNLKYNGTSKIATKIKNSSEFKSKINDIVSENPNKIFNNNEPFNLYFNDPDLHLGIKNANMTISGTLQNGSGNLSIIIEDYYDFKNESYENNSSKWYVVAINNMAWGAQEIGTINPYYITIEFDYCVNCD